MHPFIRPEKLTTLGRLIVVGVLTALAFGCSVTIPPPFNPMRTVSPPGEERPIQRVESVTADRLNVRSAAHPKAQILGTLRKGEKVKVRDRRESWVNVITPRGETGWVYAAYLTGFEPSVRKTESSDEQSKKADKRRELRVSQQPARKSHGKNRPAVHRSAKPSPSERLRERGPEMKQSGNKPEIQVTASTPGATPEKAIARSIGSLPGPGASQNGILVIRKEIEEIKQEIETAKSSQERSGNPLKMQSEEETLPEAVSSQGATPGVIATPSKDTHSASGTTAGKEYGVIETFESELSTAPFTEGSSERTTGPVVDRQKALHTVTTSAKASDSEQMHSEAVTVREKEKTPDPLSKEGKTKRMVIVKNNAGQQEIRIKSAPALAAPAIIEVKPETRLECYGKEGKWYKVKTGNGMGYIEEEFVKPVFPVPSRRSRK